MDLKQYLKDAHSLEKQVHAYEEVEKKYDKFLQKLKMEKKTIYLYEDGERTGREARRTNYIMPIPEYKPSYLGERKNKFGRTESVFGFKGAFDMFKRLPKRWWDEELVQFEKEMHNRYIMIRSIVIAVSLLIGAIGAILFQQTWIFIVLLAVGVAICLYVGDENSREYLPGDPYFEKFMFLYEKKYKKDLKAKEETFVPKIKHVELEYTTCVVSKLEESKALLEKIYEKNVIHPKYRNYIAVTQLYDYLDSNRCTDLESAFYLYEEELAKEILVTDLDLSPYQIEKLNGSMHMMMTALKEEASVVDKVVEQLHNIEKNTTLFDFVSQNDLLNEEIINTYEL